MMQYRDREVVFTRVNEVMKWRWKSSVERDIGGSQQDCSKVLGKWVLARTLLRRSFGLFLKKLDFFSSRQHITLPNDYHPLALDLV